MKSRFLLPMFVLACFSAVTVQAATAGSSSTGSTAEEEAAKARARAAADEIRAQTEAAKRQVESAREQTAKARAQAETAQADSARMEADRAMRIAELNGKVAAMRLSGTGAPTGPVTFLGVMTAPAPSSLTSQLGRPAGMGLVVVSVQAKSPVDGVLNVDDLLVRLDDQKLINNDQLTALIRSRQDGEEVAVTYVRAGKENTVKVKLAKQEALLEQRPIIKAVTQLSGPDKFAVVQANGNVIVGGNFSPAKSIAMSRFNDDAGNVSQTFNYSDATGAIEINLLDGKKKVTVREPDGTVSFSGPYDTEAERKVAPAAIQTRIAAAEARIGQTRIGVRIRSEGHTSELESH